MVTICKTVKMFNVNTCLNVKIVIAFLIDICVMENGIVGMEDEYTCNDYLCVNMFKCKFS